MPLYEYRCMDCSEIFTILQPTHSSSEPSSCPHCGKKEVRKQFSVFASNIPGRSESSGESGGHACPPSGCGCA